MSQALKLTKEQDLQLKIDVDRSLRHPVMFFFTSGAAWLALSLVLGIFASIRAHSPEFLNCSCLPFTYGRLYAAHMDALIYGWCAQAAFGTLIWLMSRLSRQPAKQPGIILVAGHIWNFTVGAGIAYILFFGASGKPWMQMPSNVYPVLLLTYVAIGIYSFVQFRTRHGVHVYISQQYILAALFWFPWVVATGYYFCHVFDSAQGMALSAAGANAWYRSALLFLFFTPVAVASAYFLAPKVTGRPVYSYSLGTLGFWLLAITGPWAGLERIFGAPYAAGIQYISAAATVLFLAPALCVGVNILLTVRGHADTVKKSPSLMFTSAGILGLLITGIIGLVLALPGASAYTNFTLARYGYEMMALYGFFSMCMFGAIYFIVPRLTGREWIAAPFIKIHYICSLYGILFVALFCGLLGGFMQGLTLDSTTEGAYAVANKAYAYNWTITIGWSFVAIANFVFCIHLLLMWLRLGRRSSHPTLFHTHEPHGVHGAEGDVDSLNAQA